MEFQIKQITSGALMKPFLSRILLLYFRHWPCNFQGCCISSRLVLPYFILDINMHISHSPNTLMISNTKEPKINGYWTSPLPPPRSELMVYWFLKTRYWRNEILAVFLNTLYKNLKWRFFWQGKMELQITQITCSRDNWGDYRSLDRFYEEYLAWVQLWNI